MPDAAELEGVYVFSTLPPLEIPSPPWKAIAALVAAVPEVEAHPDSEKLSAVAPFVAPTVFMPVILTVGNVTVVEPEAPPFTVMVQVVELIPPLKLIVPSGAG